MANRYWVGGSGDWDDTAQWSTSSGGSSGASVPSTVDNVFVDANSGSNFTITLNVISGLHHNALSMDFSDSVGLTLEFGEAGGNSELRPRGSVYFASDMIITNNTFSTTNGIRFYDNNDNGSGDWEIDFAGVNLQGLNLLFNKQASWTFLSGMVNAGIIYQYAGIVDYGNYDHSMSIFFLKEDAFTTQEMRAAKLGTGTYTINGDFDTGTAVGLVLDSDTSHLKVGGNFNSIGQDYYNVTLTSGATHALKGTNTYNNLTIETYASGTTITVDASTTQTINGTFTATGTSGNEITLVSSTPGTQYTFTKSTGVVGCDYLDLTDSNATGGARWYAGSNSADTSNNTGWVFGDATTTTFVRKNWTDQIINRLKRVIQYQTYTQVLDPITGDDTNTYTTATSIQAVFVKTAQKWWFDKEGLVQRGDAYLCVQPSVVTPVKEDRITVDNKSYYIDDILPVYSDIGNAVLLYYFCNLYAV